MKKTAILSKVSGTVNKIGFKLKKHSPEILIVVGVVGTVTSAVMACKATTKVSKVIDKTKVDVDGVHEAVEKGVTKAGEEYTLEDSKKDLTLIYVQTGVKLAKLYAPSVILGALSITSMVASNNILRKRNVALAAAYATIDKGFKEYRNRVVERFGEEVDKELRYNIKAKKVEETVVDENGKEKKVKTTVNVSELGEYSDYARYFDASSRNWEKSSMDYNRQFLSIQQNYANDLLKAKGQLFLNEVYDLLDIPRTPAGQIVGWVYNPKNDSGDNYVDFGAFETTKETENGYEPVFILDFNVDGDIWSLMK